MSKRGVAAIAGPTRPGVGQTVTYTVTQWYPNTPQSQRNPAAVTWELFKRRADGRYTSTGIRKRGVGEFTFGQRAAGQQYAVEGYLHDAEMRPPTLLHLTVGGGPPSIVRLELLRADGSPIQGPLRYGQSILARAHCANMEGRRVLFRLFEDDVNGAGHNVQNERNAGQIREVPVRRGVAEHRFVLVPDLARLANARGDGVRDRTHEYYVTAEVWEGRRRQLRSSENAEVANPTYEPESRRAPNVPSPPPSRQPQPNTPTPPSDTPQQPGPNRRQERVEVEPDVAPDPPTRPQGDRPVVVDGENTQQRQGPCACEQYNLIWGSKVTCEFRKKVVEIAAELWGEQRKIQMANALMAVMNVETAGTFKAHIIMGRPLQPLSSLTRDSFAIRNRQGKIVRSRAVGLIQFTQAALVQLGEFTNGSGFDALHDVKLRFARMGEVAQLDYVKRYFQLNNAHQRIRNPGDVYLHVFAPAGVGRSDEFVLYDSGAEYSDNRSVDTDNDGKIQRREILSRFYTSTAQGQNNRAVIRNCTDTPRQAPAATDVVTYRMEASGAIEKHVPQQIAPNMRDKYRYVYIDEDGSEHELGVFTYYSTTRMGRGNQPGSGQVELVDIRQFRQGYASGNVRARFQTWNTDSGRYYINPDCLAGLLGAMASLDITHMGFNGFSDQRARSTGGSRSHLNGTKGDLRYLSTNRNGGATILQDTHFDYNAQVEFNNALHDFGWGRTELMYSEYFNRNGRQVLLPHTKHMRKDGRGGYRHHHHLHLTGFDHSHIRVINQ